MCMHNYEMYSVHTCSYYTSHTAHNLKLFLSRSDFASNPAPQFKENVQQHAIITRSDSYIASGNNIVHNSYYA